MSDQHFLLFKDFLRYASLQIKSLASLSAEEKNLKLRSLCPSGGSRSANFTYNNAYSEPLDCIISILAQPNLPYIPVVPRMADSTIRNLQHHLTENFSRKHPNFNIQIEMFRELFLEYVVECTKNPFRMVYADNSKDCSHYIFFNCLHIKLDSNHYLPRFELEIDGVIEDITEHQKQFFSNIPVFMNSRSLTSSGMLHIKRLLLFIFLRKVLGNDPNINMALLLAQFRLSVDAHECKDFDKHHFFHSSRMLGVLRSIALRSSKINFYKLYRGRAYVSWVDHVKTCEYIKLHQAQLDQWLIYDERVYYYLIRNMSVDLSFDIFSPSTLIDDYGLKDRRSVKTLMGLNNSLFTCLTDEMRMGRHRNLHGIVLHWMSYTSKHPKPNTYAVIAMLNRLGENSMLSPSLLKNSSTQLVYFIDLLFEQTLRIWSRFRKPCTQFFFSVKQDLLIEQMFEYLYFSNPKYNPVVDDDEENEFMILTDLSVLSNRTTFASFERKIEEWHKASMLKKMELVEYPLSFKKAVCNGYTIEHLQNTLDVIDERIEMHHCIASYHDQMAVGSYAAFKVYRDNERATLGVGVTLNNNTTRSYRFNQCRGYCNNAISKTMLDAVEKFISEIENFDQCKSLDLVG